MNKLRLQVSVVSETDNKVIFQASVPVESLDTISREHGRPGITKAVMEMFDRVMSALVKK